MPHPTTPLKLPVRMRQTTVAIDHLMVPLINCLWRLGYVTYHCCQGDKDEFQPPYAPNLAYIQFRTRLEAALFVALAGPTTWDKRTHQQRQKERPEGTERWTWDWCLEGDTVRFPQRDIARALAAMTRNWRLEALIGAVSASPVPRLAAPPECPRCQLPLNGALIEFPQAHQSAPHKTCPTCGGVVLSRRKDARFCSRRCQLAARDRKAVKARGAAHPRKPLRVKSGFRRGGGMFGLM